MSAANNIRELPADRLIIAVFAAARRALKPKVFARFREELEREALEMLEDGRDLGNVYSLAHGGAPLHEAPYYKGRGEAGALIMRELEFRREGVRGDAATLVASAVGERPEPERGRFLRELLAHTAAGLVVTEGPEEASEAVYRLADAVVVRASDDPVWP
ncbi:hypothetical protein [Phenylobacterium kunshanense]|uniref:Uncharacterized protein n=1 Tax=Phenylobacterium kunshanense TaxID=1445034 RepID=A0A328BSR1_9CAUL|nr:hypothetical protein [Phenylobacterium kunshanense]RAK68884.1 hypothetical protein DJ019_02395 [Phenylobacterium kunshanense]